MYEIHSSTTVITCVWLNRGLNSPFKCCRQYRGVTDTLNTGNQLENDFFLLSYERTEF